MDVEDIDILGPGYVGRDFPYTAVGDWVNLSGISCQAKAVYWTLAMHVNHQRGDSMVWPTRATLADICGFKKEQSVGRYIQELVDLGAIEVFTFRDGIKKRNYYVVHKAPPENYLPPVSVQAYYSNRTDKNIAELEAELGKSSVILPPQFRGGSVFQHRTSDNSGMSSVESSVSCDGTSDNSDASSVEKHAEFGKTPGRTVVPSRALPRYPTGHYRGTPQGTTEVPHRALKPNELNKKKLTTSPHGPPVEEKQEEGVEVELSPRQSTLDMLLSIEIPDGKRAPGRRSEKLMHVGTRIDEILNSNRGISIESLRHHLAVDLDSVTHSIAGVWLHRLRDTELPESTPQRASSVPVEPCGECEGRKNEPHSARINSDGSFCQLCHPSVFK